MAVNPYDAHPTSAAGLPVVVDEGPGFLKLSMFGQTVRFQKAWTDEELQAVEGDPSADDRTRSLAKSLRGVQAERNILKEAVESVRAIADDLYERDCDCRYDYEYD